MQIQKIHNGTKHSTCNFFRINSTIILIFLSIHSRLEKNQEHLYIKVHDEDGPIDRDTIGSAKIDLDSVRNAGQSEQWVKLPRLFGLTSNGEVLIRMNYTA